MQLFLLKIYVNHFVNYLYNIKALFNLLKNIKQY